MKNLSKQLFISAVSALSLYLIVNICCTVRVPDHAEPTRDGQLEDRHPDHRQDRQRGGTDGRGLPFVLIWVKYLKQTSLIEN